MDTISSIELTQTTRVRSDGELLENDGLPFF